MPNKHQAISENFSTTSVNLLWPVDIIWRHKTRSTLAQVMAWCLTAPSHYLNQYWLVISEVQWQSLEGNFIRDTSTINHSNLLVHLKLHSILLSANEFFFHGGTILIHNPWCAYRCPDYKPMRGHQDTHTKINDYKYNFIDQTSLFKIAYQIQICITRVN